MTKSKIEYLTHVWNFYTGCRHQETGVCSLPCWAKAMAHRFGCSFEPSFRQHIIDAPVRSKLGSRRIGVCFTGDLFGDWINPDMEFKCCTKLGDFQASYILKSYVKSLITNCPDDQFLFLTKAPWNISAWGPFPDNAWVGVSVTDTKSLMRAVNYLFTPLQTGTVKHAWLSIEPLLDLDTSRFVYPLSDSLKGISWVVIGAQTHPNIYPKIEWVHEIVEACDKAGIPVFLKNNLVDGFHAAGIDIPRRQELPVKRINP